MFDHKHPQTHLNILQVQGPTRVSLTCPVLSFPQVFRTQALASSQENSPRENSEVQAAAEAIFQDTVPGPPAHLKGLKRTRLDVVPTRPPTKPKKRQQCDEPDCTTRPLYNTDGEVKALYCRSHKKTGMVNVLTRTCHKSGCKIIPIFNFEGSTQGLYCNTHKEQDMVDVRSLRCAHPDCNKAQPSYNVMGAKGGLYCVDHQLKGMLDVSHKRCDEVDCQLRPSYGLLGSAYDSFCSAHKKAGMVTRVSVNKAVK